MGAIEESETLEMNQRERDRLKVLHGVIQGERSQKEAARLLRLTTRQVRRLVRRIEAEGDQGLIHRLRGRPSNRSSSAELRQQVLAEYRGCYAGFGPTLASEKLAAQGLRVSHDSLRRWLIADGLWERQRKRDQHRQRRTRRECFGELIQMDTSIHDWLEGRGEAMVLVAMIDDATGRVEAGSMRERPWKRISTCSGAGSGRTAGRWRCTPIGTAFSRRKRKDGPITAVKRSLAGP